jgi:hypothetical protein
LDLNELITITEEDIDTEKGSRSRLGVGTTLTRGEMLHLALMSVKTVQPMRLGRTYPGGLKVFVEQMNVKAKLLGMTDTRYVEPTGLSSKNQSSARDLAVLVNVAYMDPLLRDYSVTRLRGGFGPQDPAIQQHQSAGEEPLVGYWAAKNRLYRRGGALLGDANPDCGAQAHHGVSGFCGQAQPYRRCPACSPVA